MRVWRALLVSAVAGVALWWVDGRFGCPSAPAPPRTCQRCPNTSP